MTPSDEMAIEFTTIRLSFAAKAAFATIYALTVQHQTEEIQAADVRRILGLSESAWEAIYEELVEDGALWNVGNGEVVQILSASAILSRAIGAPGRPKASVWESLRARVLHELPCCAYCGAEEDLTVDHIVAVELGGSNHEANLTTACKSCNSAKGAMPWHEWHRRIGAMAR